MAMSERPSRPIHTAEKPDPMMLSNWRVRVWAVRVPMAAAGLRAQTRVSPGPEEVFRERESNAQVMTVNPCETAVKFEPLGTS